MPPIIACSNLLTHAPFPPQLLDRSEDIALLTAQIVESDPDGGCMRCSVPLPPATPSEERPSAHQHSNEERRVCGCCGIVVCSICCSKLVYEVYTRTVIKICPHCYRESSRVKHPIYEGTNLETVAGEVAEQGFVRIKKVEKHESFVGEGDYKRLGGGGGQTIELPPTPASPASPISEDCEVLADGTTACGDDEYATPRSSCDRKFHDCDEGEEVSRGHTHTPHHTHTHVCEQRPCSFVNKDGRWENV